MLFAFLTGFLSGAVALVVAETLGFIFFMSRLKRRAEAVAASTQLSQSDSGLDSLQSLEFALNKKGTVWILEADKLPKEQKRKNEVLEVSPVRKNARIKDQSLILTESDGSHMKISLKGCVVSAVSATDISSKKWAKRYPVKVENRTSVLYNGRKMFYIYLETCWEKESWCKALRLASFDNEKIEWFVKQNEDFHSYLTSLNAGCPFFFKPSLGFLAEPVDRINKADGSSSKVRHFWRKLSKKASKAGSENKLTLNPLPKALSLRDSASNAGSSKAVLKEKVSMDDTVISPSSSSSTLFHAGSLSNSSFVSDPEADDKYCIDEGTLCWNLLISRLFFDARSSMEINNFLQARIQRALSDMRVPTYIGDVICTGIHTGNIPPYIHNMRVLPMDMNEVWAIETDIEYSGGASLDIETRLEVRELDSQKRVMNTGSTGDVRTDFLEEIENIEEELKRSQVSSDTVELKEQNNHIEGKSTSTPVHTPRWRSVIDSVAKQVSQTRLSFTIKAASLKGTLRLHIKPPPSDQLWFGFTSMPDIDLHLESCVGDCKISSGQIPMLLVSRFKAAIQDSIVLPNCEYVCIPWMLGDRDDWVPRSVAPFMRPSESSATHPATTKSKIRVPSEMNSDEPKAKCEERSADEPEPLSASSSSQELRNPLIEADDSRESRYQDSKEDDAKPGRMGRKARMLDLGKRMGEKLEEKKRHIEERGRNIVEKMRGPGSGHL